MHRKFLFIGGGLISIGGFVSIVWLSYCSQAAMRESPQLAASYYKLYGKTNDLVLNKFSVEILRKKGVLVIDNVLSEQEINEVRKEINLMIKNSSNFELNGHSDLKTRSDKVFWVNDPASGSKEMQLSIMRNGLNPGLLRAIRRVRSIPNELIEFGYFCEDMGVPLSNQVVIINIGR